MHLADIVANLLHAEGARAEFCPEADMNTHTQIRQHDPVARDALRFLRTWNIIVSDDGIVSISPCGPTLRLVELACLIKRLRTCSDGIFPSEIRFDLSGVRVVGAEPRLVARLISFFARSVNARCLLVGETGHA